ncbi:MAG: N-acetylmuramoyl-L-alanine amidase family protein [Faecalibacterium sp.]
MNSPSISGWHGSVSGRYYVSSHTGERLKGLYQIGDDLFFFDERGVLMTGWIQRDGYVYFSNKKGQITRGESEVNGTTYYFQPDNGRLLTGWNRVNGTLYCFDLTGHPRSGFYEENGTRWYLQTDGSVYVGYHEDADGNLYYFSENGRVVDDFVTLDGRRYYYDAAGDYVTGWYKTWDGWYLFDDQGVQQTGWQEHEGTRLYYDPETGEKAEGWTDVDGMQLYFLYSGEAAQGWMELDGNYYWFADGVSQSGWAGNGSRRFYLDGNGNYCTGWTVIDQQPYAFDEMGALRNGWYRINGKTYYFVDGISQSGTISSGSAAYTLNGCGDLSAQTEQAVDVSSENEESEGVKEDDSAGGETVQKPAATAFSVTLTLNGKSITLGTQLKTLEDFPGRPNSTEQTSNVSGIYHYTGFDLYSKAFDSSTQRVEAITILSAELATVEGVRVGMDESAVMQIYGEPSGKSGDTFTYQNTDGHKLLVTFSAGVVQQIKYQL